MIMTFIEKAQNIHDAKFRSHFVGLCAPGSIENQRKGSYSALPVIAIRLKRARSPVLPMSIDEFFNINESELY